MQNKEKTKRIVNGMNEEAYSEGCYMPKWEDYNIMQSRWKYVCPQTKRLVPDYELLVPITSDSDMVSVSTEDGRKSPIKGNYVNVEHFTSTTRSISSRQSIHRSKSSSFS